MKKGQLFSGDLTIATTVFLFSLSLAFVIWQIVSEDIVNAEELRSMEKLTSEFSEQLIRTPGAAEDWRYYNVRITGIASEGRVINLTKASWFIELMNGTNYDTNRYKAGIGGYEFWVNVTDLDGNTQSVYGVPFVTGKEPVDETTEIAVARTALLNDTIVRFNMVIWR